MPKDDSDISWFLNDLPIGMNLEDDELCQSLLETTKENVNDLIQFLTNEQTFDLSELDTLATPKFVYDEGDSYDWHIALGCLNCGAEFNIQDYGAISMFPDTLICTHCGFSPCPRHHQPTNQENERLIYLMGTRKYYHFADQRKEWWEEYFLPASDRDERMAYQLRAVETMSKNKGHVITEECSLCDHDQAYYHTFQARSADEGMTIMYECCKCGARKVFNN